MPPRHFQVIPNERDASDTYRSLIEWTPREGIGKMIRCDAIMQETLILELLLEAGYEEWVPNER